MPDQPAMITAPLLTMLTATMADQSTDLSAMGQAPLSVSAIVIRPVAVPASIGDDVPAFMIGEIAAVEVGALGATVGPRDGDRVVVTPDGSDRITITLVY